LPGDFCKAKIADEFKVFLQTFAESDQPKCPMPVFGSLKPRRGNLLLNDGLPSRNLQGEKTKSYFAPPGGTTKGSFRKAKAGRALRSSI
jgi:hypothetical protein